MTTIPTRVPVQLSIMGVPQVPSDLIGPIGKDDFVYVVYNLGPEFFETCMASPDNPRTAQAYASARQQFERIQRIAERHHGTPLDGAMGYRHVLKPTVIRDRASGNYWLELHGHLGKRANDPVPEETRVA